MTSKFSSKRPLTNEEEAEIQKMIAADPDNPELTDEEMARARPFREVFPKMADAMEREVAKRGRPRVENPKEAVTLRLDPAIVAFYKSAGPEWRTNMAEALASAALESGTIEVTVNAKIKPKAGARTRKVASR